VAEQFNSPLAQLDVLPISSWVYPRVLLGIPIERTLSHADKTFFSFAEIFSQGPSFIRSTYGRIDVVRNQMVLELLRSTATHLLMLDSDHAHPANIIQSLCRWPLLYEEVRVVSGLNFRRKAPHDPVFGNLTADGDRPIVTEWDQGLLTTEESGAASLLVHRSVFEEMPGPWFKNVYTEDDWYRNSWPGEDIHFSRECQRLGIPFYIDTTTSSPHCTDTLVTEETFRQYMARHPEEFNDVQPSDS